MDMNHWPHLRGPENSPTAKNDSDRVLYVFVLKFVVLFLKNRQVQKFQGKKSIHDLDIWTPAAEWVSEWVRMCVCCSLVPFHSSGDLRPPELPCCHLLQVLHGNQTHAWLRIRPPNLFFFLLLFDPSSVHVSVQVSSDSVLFIFFPFFIFYFLRRNKNPKGRHPEVEVVVMKPDK